MDARSALGVAMLMLVVVGAGLAPVAGQTASDANETSVEAGEHSVAVVAVERATVEGAVERRRLAYDLEAAANERERAAVVSNYLNRSRERLLALQRRESELDAAAANGSMRPGLRATRGARLAAEADGIARLAVDLRSAAAALSANARRDAGIRLSEIDLLREDAVALADRNRGLATADARVYASIERMVATYNERGEPEGLLADRLRGEKVNLHVDAGRDDAVVSFRVDEDGRLTDVRAGPRGDATVKMETDGRTVDRIAAADEPAATLREAADDGDVTVSGIGPADSLEWSLVDLVDTLSDLF